MTSNANMTLWDSVQKTDPSHTKKVDIGRKFTSIDAHYQIMQATAAFGPVGQGWGYTVEHSTVTAGAAVLAAADVLFWVGNRANCFGPWRGMAEVINLKGKIDDDAAKKATTDAITKALSHLGFNADVFLGRFDDNKYVAKMAAEFADKPEPISEADQLRVADFSEAIEQATDDIALAKVAKELAGCGLPAGLLTTLRALYSAKHAAFKRAASA